MIDLDSMLKQFERVALETALHVSNGCVSVAAKTVGLQRTTFMERAKRHKIDVDSFRESFMEKKILNLPADKGFRIRMLEHAKGVLDSCGGNRTQAAKELGISLRTMRNWINTMKKISQ